MIKILRLPKDAIPQELWDDPKKHAHFWEWAWPALVQSSARKAIK